MLDKQQLVSDINRMNCKQRYAHVLSAMHILFTKPDDTETKRAALLIARTHLELLNSSTG